MIAEHLLFLIGGEDDENGTLTIFDGDDHRLTFGFRDVVIEATGSNFFDSFCTIRLALEQERIIPFCYGASLNVFPSRMARDMGRGLQAYKLTLGKHAAQEELKYIFDEGPDVIPAYVHRQKEYFEHWLATPKS